MLEAHFEPTWSTLPNPYTNPGDNSSIVTGHISGRSTDITQIVMGSQSALILTGAPRIGKSALIRYLQRTPEDKWSWRDELTMLREQLDMEHIHFIAVDLTLFEDIENTDQLLSFFITQCSHALLPFAPQHQGKASDDITDLYTLIRDIHRTHPSGRYFLMFDTIERLERPGKKLFKQFALDSIAQTAQERSIALLDRSGAIRTLVDLMDTFHNIGAIFSLQALPRPTMGDQFTHVSADLARFTPMTLQAFSWQDAQKMLNQPPENFGENWAVQFQKLGSREIFTPEEQSWILNQAGTHPYLLQQLCFHAFHFKQQYAIQAQAWSKLQIDQQRQLLELVEERLSTFLASTWRRIQEAVEQSSPETKNRFFEFIRSLNYCSAKDTLEQKAWSDMGAELRYILYSEGIVRFDPFQPVHYPGAILCRYLKEKGDENATTPVKGFWLTIMRPDVQRERISLSELEYRLLKTLLQHPARCSEEELMQGAWGKPIERSTFTQRMHHLRKKLKEKCSGTDIIENHYGGQYSLLHSEWFRLE